MRRCKSPYTVKRLSKFVRPVAAWTQMQVQLLAELTECKFGQHPELREALLDTKERRLIEATRDTFYGAGETLQTIEANINTFKGANKLGTILANIRDNISKTTGTTKTKRTKKTVVVTETAPAGLGTERPVTDIDTDAVAIVTVDAAPKDDRADKVTVEDNTDSDDSSVGSD